ncbi:hypothetical protein ROHU_023272 [Labeo rohita]|uniref:Uncharacterized protein n=1 Tax=Labeo rohita TaxID=84645 RepID=A0A498LFK3_LABRO|nr:hypothetical protein ROHU_012212 [Labeo rohita]RXN22764.1 hypothetical protein ROHU_023272 [Labeo rohita]
MFTAPLLEGPLTLRDSKMDPINNHLGVLSSASDASFKEFFCVVSTGQDICAEGAMKSCPGLVANSNDDSRCCTEGTDEPRR